MSVLERAVETGRLHHAYLFAGLEGVGKFQVAQSLAAVLNCERRPEESFSEACGRCSSCRKIGAQQHPDVLFVSPEGRNIKISQIRTIQKASMSAPFEGRFRVVLIDDAHTMTEEAANALLKTLEEPSKRMRLILVTDQPHRLLDTIISRCQLLRFGALEIDTVVELLRGLATEGHIDDNADAQSLLAVAAGYGEGSLGRSLSVLESGMLAERRTFVADVLKVSAARPRELLDQAESIGKGNDRLHLQLDVLKLFFRDVMLFQVSGAGRVINRDLLDLVDEHAVRFGVDEVVQLVDEICQAQERLARNINAQLVIEDVLRRVDAAATR
ncbi:MAG: DNA polymerase III subunit delta' [Bradymonadaceae bacterium]